MHLHTYDLSEINTATHLWLWVICTFIHLSLFTVSITDLVHWTLFHYSQWASLTLYTGPFHYSQGASFTLYTGPFHYSQWASFTLYTGPFHYSQWASFTLYTGPFHYSQSIIYPVHWTLSLFTECIIYPVHWTLSLFTENIIYPVHWAPPSSPPKESNKSGHKKGLSEDRVSGTQKYEGTGFRRQKMVLKHWWSLNTQYQNVHRFNPLV